MRSLFLFLLLSLSSFIIGPPVDDRHLIQRRGDDEEAMDIDEPGPSTDKEECYFAQKRTSDYEKEPRSLFSEVKGKMSDLMEVQLNNLYQCPNYPALIFARGAGEYINWSDKNQVEAIGRRMICLFPLHYHYKRRTRDEPNRKTKRVDPICSMPPPFDQHDDPVVLHDEIHFIEADEARAILIKKGVSIHPALPVCAAHNEAARKILAQVTVESGGYNIRPPPLEQDLSITPDITRNVNPYSDDRDEIDPGFFPSRRTCPAPIRVEYLPPPKFPSVVLYVNFMQSLGLDPSIAAKNWHELDERSQRRKEEGLSRATDAMAHFMAPADPISLKLIALKGALPYERPRATEFVQMMEHVRMAFMYAPSRSEKIAALAMVSHHSLSEIQKFMPGLTYHYLKATRMYVKRGYHLVEFIHRRVRFREDHVDRLLQFVSSYKVTIGLSFRTRFMKDSHAKWIEIPNTLRALRAGEIWYMYKKDLEDTRELDKLVPESTARKILRICRAERRKCLHGVDIVIADAMEAFDRADIVIEKMMTNNWISKTWHDSLRSMMLASRQYLRTDYLIHGKEFSMTGDHCWSHGLSDPNEPLFQVDCRKQGKTGCTLIISSANNARMCKCGSEICERLWMNY